MEGFIEFKKDIESDIQKCYGALSSFQVQLHHINGIMEEIQSMCEEILCDIRDMDEDLKKIKDER